MDDWEKDFLFIKDVGNTFAYLVKEIIRKKMFLKWSKREKKIQLLNKEMESSLSKRMMEGDLVAKDLLTIV